VDPIESGISVGQAERNKRLTSLTEGVFSFSGGEGVKGRLSVVGVADESDHTHH
jgi:hypothetical protein